MTFIGILLIALAALTLVLLQLLRILLAQHEKAFGDAVQDLDHRLACVQKDLASLSTLIEDLEYSPGERRDRRHRRLFERAAELTLPRIRRLAPDEWLYLICRSHFYPSEQGHTERFTYRHGTVDESQPSPQGLVVRGYRRDTVDEEWQPFTFLADDKGASTSSCEGTIRELR